ncbi:MAG TPA: hypothetical protein VK395_02760, partial [Gemmataceae bacterium]|nr:hypothetical protein [Gemmataceae bacterium]
MAVFSAIFISPAPASTGKDSCQPEHSGGVASAAPTRHGLGVRGDRGTSNPDLPYLTTAFMPW